jgi:hypothetical protein
MARDVPALRRPSEFLTSSDMGLGAFRLAVSDVTAQVARKAKAGPRRRADVEGVLAANLFDPDLESVLSRVPGGADGVAQGLLHEVRRYRPSSRSSARDVAGLVRIYLLSQIDTAWWAGVPMFSSDEDVLVSCALVDLDRLRRRGRLEFRYRRQPAGLAGRARDWAMRRVAPGRRPHTSGLRFAQARPECVVMLNQLAREFSAAAPAGTPPLWVTSVVRSAQHQHHLRSLGYAAVLPSAHCCGYAMDVEMRWFRRFDADRALAALLLERQDAGLINVIDEGQAWHICLSPTSRDGLRRAYAAAMGS